MGKSNHYSAELFIKAIPGTGGIISLIARKLDVDWHTVKKYIEEYATVKRAYEAEKEGITDLAEAGLIKAIRDGEFQAIKFYLTTKAKDRGYVERQQIEHSGPDGNKLQLDVIISSALEKAYDDGDNGNGSTE